MHWFSVVGEVAQLNKYGVRFSVGIITFGMTHFSGSSALASPSMVIFYHHASIGKRLIANLALYLGFVLFATFKVLNKETTNPLLFDVYFSNHSNV